MRKIRILDYQFRNYNKGKLIVYYDHNDSNVGISSCYNGSHYGAYFEYAYYDYSKYNHYAIYDKILEKLYKKIGYLDQDQRYAERA